MSAYADPSRRLRNIAVTSFALVLPLSAHALDSVPPEAVLSVKVFADRYVAGGKPFSELAALEAWTKANHGRVLWLDTCGAASTRQLLAAVERLHRVYVERVQIRTFVAGELACLGSAGWEWTDGPY